MQTAQRTRPIAEAASEFLANKRIAVTGVSRHPSDHGSNTVYKRLKERGYQVWTRSIPADITPKNRLLLGAPRPDSRVLSTNGHGT